MGEPLLSSRTPSRADGRRLVLGSLLVLATSGCGKILGVDEYAVGEPPSDNPCGALQAWAGGGKCVKVGVAECGDGFKSDGNGGCDPNLGTIVCPPGQFARPEAVTCSTVDACDPSGRFSFPTTHDSPNSYVNAGAANGSGTADAPFGTIGEALQQLGKRPVQPGFVPWIVIGDGTYTENLVVTFPVALVGDCPDKTILIALDPTTPVVTFGQGATASTLGGLNVQGGSAGVLVDGADQVSIASSEITASDGPAIIARDANTHGAGPSPGITVNLGTEPFDGVSTPAPLLIDGALGAGILSYGANLALDSVLVRRTRDPGPGKDTGGVCIRPSPWVPKLDEGGQQSYWDPRQVARPTLTVSRSVIEDNAGAGLSIVGAIATVTSSLVRATGTAGVPDQRVGIDVAEHPFGDVAATLTLTQSVVEGSSVEGIRGRNATMTIENTVVRDIRPLSGDSGSAVGTTRCLGSGVRFRWDRPPDVLDSGEPAEQTPPLIVKTSLVERTRDTGILVEGAAAQVESSIVRTTAVDSCAGDLGDGIGVYGHVFAPASLILGTSRIEGSARAAIAAFGGNAVSSLSVNSAVLAGARGVVVDTASPEPKLTDALCDATGSAACTANRAKLEPSLLGGNGCDPDDDTVCLAQCDLDSVSSPSLPLLNERIWAVDHDEIAPVVTDSNGCYGLEGLPRNAELILDESTPVPPPATPFRVSSYAQAYSAGSELITTGTTDSAPRLTIPSEGQFVVFPEAEPIAQVAQPSFAFDFLTAPLVGIYVCAANPERLAPGTDACRGGDPSRAVAGVQVTLDPDAGVRTYWLNGVPNATATATDAGSVDYALGLFFGVPPGQYHVHLTAADPSKTLKCNFDTSHGPITGGQNPGDDKDKNTFRIAVLPGQVTGLKAFCSLD